MVTKKLNINDFVFKSKRVHGDLYDYSLAIYNNNNTKLKIICNIHGEFEQLPRSHYSGIGCSKCSKSTLSIGEFISKSHKIYESRYDYSLISNFSNTSIILINCKEHGSFKLRADLHLSGTGCAKCFGNKKLTTIDFIEKSKIKYHYHKYEYSKTLYVNYSTPLVITCPIHGDFKVKPNLHLKGNSHCNGCSNRKIWNFSYFEKEANTIHNGKYNYFQEGFKNSRTKIKIECPSHGVFHQTPESHIRNKSGCPTCKTSKGELSIENILKSNEIIFEKQKTFPNCKFISNLKFDFYLPNYNICIEYNGRQHYEEVEAFGGYDEFSKTKKRDKIKHEYCDNNGINLCVIKYTEDISSKISEFIYGIS